MKLSLLYGIQNWGEAYLIPTWLMRQQWLAQVKSMKSVLSCSGEARWFSLLSVLTGVWMTCMCQTAQGD